MRHRAWLSAPRDRCEPSAGGKRRELPSRYEELRRDKRPVVLPHVPHGQHLLRHLWDVGPSVPGVNGPQPVPYSELQSWQHMRGVRLSPWEAWCLRSLSQEWCAQFEEARSPAAPRPGQAQATPEHSRAVARQLAMGFASLGFRMERVSTSTTTGSPPSHPVPPTP